MKGHLDLVCAVDSEGRSFLREQSFSAPMHLSKPFTDAETLVVNVVNPTAGLFSGDEIECSVRVKNGARLLLTSPSASRVHRAREGMAAARMRQRFSVACDGFLEVLPEIFIPQAGSIYAQQTRVDVEPGATLLLWETLTPGRVASGEAWEFAQLDWETDVFFGSEKIVRERYALSPADESLRSLRGRFPAAYYASCFALGEPFGASAECWAAIHALHEDASAWIGCSRFANGGGVVKVLAENSVVMRAKLREIRRLLYTALGRCAPNLRRF